MNEAVWEASATGVATWSRGRYWVAVAAARAFRQATTAMARTATAAMPARYSQEAALILFVSPAASCTSVVKDDSSDHSDQAPWLS